MGWLIGCGGGSQVIEDSEEEDDAIMRMGLCGTGLMRHSSSRERMSERPSRESWNEPRGGRTASYDADPPRIIVLGGSDKDQSGGVGRDLLIPRGTLGSVVLNNVRPSVFDEAEATLSFVVILKTTAAAIISVDTTELYWTVTVRRWADRLRATVIPVALLVENEGVNESAVNHHVSSLREAFANPFVGVFFKSQRRDETAACVDSLLSFATRAHDAAPTVLGTAMTTL